MLSVTSILQLLKIRLFFNDDLSGFMEGFSLVGRLDKIEWLKIFELFLLNGLGDFRICTGTRRRYFQIYEEIDENILLQSTYAGFHFLLCL